MYGKPKDDDERKTFGVADGVTRTNEGDWDDVPPNADVVMGARI